MKEEFKIFASKNPSLASYVNDGSMTWQKFYEMFSMYGENSDVWSKYKTYKESSNIKINDLIRGIDVDQVKEHISTAQKALDFVQELTSKNVVSPKSVTTPRPLNKFFED